MWFSSLNCGMNNDVKLGIPLTLVKCFEMPVKGARRARTGSCIENVFTAAWSSHVVSSVDEETILSLSSL